MADTAFGAQAGVARQRGLAIAAGAVGNLLEFYDWGIYSFLAAVFSEQFFPNHSRTASLLLTFSVFAIGFVMRPLGGLVFGSIGDRMGRRRALALGIMLMACGSLAIAVVPGYAGVGLAAPVVLVLARLVQGFSVGGEFGTSGAYVIEHAPPGRRGLMGSVNQSGVVAGSLLAAVVAALLTNVMSHQALTGWGWRVGFAVGALIGFFGLFLRLRAPDTPAFRKLNQRKAIAQRPGVELLTKHRAGTARVIGMTVAGTITYYVWLIYLPNYVHQTTGMPLSTALVINTIVQVLFLLLLPLGGWLSDRVGRRPMLLGFSLGFAVLTYPLTRLLTDQFASVLTIEIVAIILLVGYSSTAGAAYAEVFPSRVRTVGIAFPYALAVAVFGGTAPFLNTWLVSLGSSSYFVYYTIAACLVSAFVYLRMPETAKRELE